MNSKFITSQLLMTCLSADRTIKPDIHAELQKTINERKKILKTLENITRRAEQVKIYLTCYQAA